MRSLFPVNKAIGNASTSRHSQSSFFIKSFFSEPRWLNSCFKLQKTIPDYFFIIMVIIKNLSI